MAKKSDPTADLGSGTYYVPEVGIVTNGTVLDGSDPDAIAAYHAQDDKARDQSLSALADRDAVLTEVVAAPADAAPTGKE